VPTACSSDGVRVEIGANFTKPNYYYVFECRNVSQYSIHLVPVACKQQDKTIQPGESYVFQSFWFTCVQKAPGVLQLQASGCVTETGEKVTANNTYKTKDFVYNCFTKADGSVYTHPQACIFDGKEYQPEQEAISESKSCWYQCQRTPDGMRLQLMGCLEGSKKYQVGERIIFGDYVYQCIRNAADQSVTREPVGCVEGGNGSQVGNGTQVERKFGERWTEGATNPKYVYECKGDSKSVFKTPVQCVYEGPEGRGQLDGGCMRRFGTTVMQCYRGEANSVYGNLITDAPADFEDRSKPAGLKVC